MSNSMPLAFNPREESAEVLEEMLVGRHEILNELESDLLAQAVSATRQHWLIRGPRGIGKTHLIAVLYHWILKKPELSYFLPVWLGEAETFDAYSQACCCSRSQSVWPRNLTAVIPTRRLRYVR